MTECADCVPVHIYPAWGASAQCLDLEPSKPHPRHIHKSCSRNILLKTNNYNTVWFGNYWAARCRPCAEHGSMSCSPTITAKSPQSPNGNKHTALPCHRGVRKERKTTVLRGLQPRRGFLEPTNFSKFLILQTKSHLLWINVCNFTPNFTKSCFLEAIFVSLGGLRNRDSIRGNKSSQAFKFWKKVWPLFLYFCTFQGLIKISPFNIC